MSYERVELSPDCIIYRGDCREVLPTLEFDIVITDPPYGLGDRMQGGTWGAAEKYADMRRWDIAPESSLLRELCDGRTGIIWGGNYFDLPPSRCWLVWDKQNAVPTMSDVEMAWTNIDAPAKRKSLPVGVHNYGHPSEKPETLMRWCVGFASGDVVLDPYMGTGTTGAACLSLGRKFIGIEIDPHYFAIARKRLERELAQGKFNFAEVR